MNRSNGIIVMWLMCVFSACGVYMSYTTKFVVHGAVLSVLAALVIVTIAVLIRGK